VYKALCKLLAVSDTFWYSGVEIQDYRSTMFSCRVMVLHDHSPYLVHTDRKTSRNIKISHHILYDTRFSWR